MQKKIPTFESEADIESGKAKLIPAKTVFRRARQALRQTKPAARNSSDRKR